MTAAAFKATYSDWRLIKTRSVVQIIFEVPLDASDAAYQVVGGMPDFGSERWFAIARLNHTPAKEVGHGPELMGLSTAKPAPASDPHPARAHKSWHEMPAAQQSGVLCGDPVFHKFLWERYPEIDLFNTGTGKERVAEFIRLTCGVETRADILPGTKADRRWRELVSEYRAWVAEPAVVA